MHAIITGGSSGIGKATAKLLAAEGVHVSIIARDKVKLETAKNEIDAVKIKPEQRVLAAAADVSNYAEIETAIKEAIALLGPPDLLIASAGIARPGYFRELPLEVFEETMKVNYFGSLYSIKAVLPAMEKEGKGQIVLISSGAGLIGIYGYTSYCPTKFAIRGLAESLRGELKESGINVFVVYPPDTDTPQLVEENKTKPPETKAITGQAKMWSAEEVAGEIVRGIRKKKVAIAPGLEMTLIARLHSLLAPIINWYLDRIVVSSKK